MKSRSLKAEERRSIKNLLTTGLLGAALLTANPVLAAPATCPASAYTVQEGDNLSDLSASNWERLEQLNLPYLEGRRKNMSNGKTDVRIYPGECLVGVQKIDGKLVLVENYPNNTTGSNFQSFVVKQGPWLLLALLALGAALAALYFRHHLAKDPIRSGPPQVPGGVTADSLRERFTREGQAAQVPYRVTEVNRGFGYGTMNVSYHGQRPQPRVLNGEVVFEVSRVNNEDRPLPAVYSLQACGNDVRQGLLTQLPGRDFRFERTREEIPAPATTPEPVPAAVNDVSSVEVPDTTQPGRRAIFSCFGETDRGKPPMIQFDRNLVHVEIGEDGMTKIRFVSQDTGGTTSAEDSRADAA